MNQQPDIDAIHIVPGLRCTLACGHCFNSSSPTQKGGIDDIEINRIINAIRSQKPKEIILTGGEPTLYIRELNQILEQIPGESRVILTTNGLFAKDTLSTEKILDQFFRISTVQLSYDPFHGSQPDKAVPLHLKNYCQDRNIGFSVIVSISKPSEILFARELEKKWQCNVVFQQVDGSGRARETGSEFEFPIFDKSVLEKKCPNTNTISYIHKKGFTPCCSNVIFNLDDDGYANESIDDLLQSDFYHEVTSKNMRDRMLTLGLSQENLPPRLSSICNLCEHIERNRRGLCH